MAPGCQFPAVSPEPVRIPESNLMTPAFPGDVAFDPDQVFLGLLKVTLPIHGTYGSTSAARMAAMSSSV